jgi:hypothetical protein
MSSTTALSSRRCIGEQRAGSYRPLVQRDTAATSRSVPSEHCLAGALGQESMDSVTGVFGVEEADRRIDQQSVGASDPARQIRLPCTKRRSLT